MLSIPTSYLYLNCFKSVELYMRVIAEQLYEKRYIPRYLHNNIVIWFTYYLPN